MFIRTGKNSERNIWLRPTFADMKQKCNKMIMCYDNYWNLNETVGICFHNHDSYGWRINTKEKDLFSFLSRFWNVTTKSQNITTIAMSFLLRRYKVYPQKCPNNEIVMYMHTAIIKGLLSSGANPLVKSLSCKMVYFVE